MEFATPHARDHQRGGATLARVQVMAVVRASKLVVRAVLRARTSEMPSSILRAIGVFTRT